jgi:hypothetical protein
MIRLAGEQVEKICTHPIYSRQNGKTISDLIGTGSITFWMLLLSAPMYGEEKSQDISDAINAHLPSTLVS